jgi:hypothetical protein
MANCVHHPGSKAVYTVYGKSYCDKCQKEMETARKSVDKHVVPKDCFIMYKNAKEGWVEIDGTGCAHWVAHQRNIQKGSTDSKCLAGFTLKVTDAVSGKTVVPVEKVQVGDFYAETGLHHMGLVCAVTKPKKAGDPPEITIQHDSNKQGGLVKGTFADRFKSKGTFYR